MRILVLVALSAVVIAHGCGSQQCPSDWFDVSFSIIADMFLPVSDTLDSELHFFKEILKFTDAEIDDATHESIKFFNKSFGLDFSKSPVDAAGRRLFENAVMFPFQAPFDPPVSHNRWVISGNTGVNRCFYSKEGGYQVSFIGAQTLYGTYGGGQGTHS